MGVGGLFAGFVKGAADYGADQIKRRQDAELDMQKAQMLEKLRLDTEKEMATFRDQLDKNDVDAQLSETDYARKKKVFRNKKGEVVSERDLTPSELQDYETQNKANDLGLKNIESQISSRAHDDANSDASLELQRASTGASIAESRARTAHLEASDPLDGKKVLAKEYNQTVTDLTKAGANPSQIANFQTNWYDGVNNSKWTPSQQRVFLMKMRQEFTKKGGLMQKFATANTLLDAKIAGTDLTEDDTTP